MYLPRVAQLAEQYLKPSFQKFVGFLFVRLVYSLRPLSGIGSGSAPVFLNWKC